MSSPRALADRSSLTRALGAEALYSYRRPAARQLNHFERRPAPTQPPARRHHFHATPPGPHRQYGDYVYDARWGWWPRWYPYWDQRWFAYWWDLYDRYGGDARPEYAEYERDAYLRQHARQLNLRVFGGRSYVGRDPLLPSHDTGVIVRDHRSPRPGGHDPWPVHTQPIVVVPAPVHPVHPVQPSPQPQPQPQPSPQPQPQRQRYQHPHFYYGDYVVVENGAWWPQWFPYQDPAWYAYWWQLYNYYGGDAYRDYAEYARDAILRAYAPQLGWL